jgi:hypothetical protein
MAIQVASIYSTVILLLKWAYYISFMSNVNIWYMYDSKYKTMDNKVLPFVFLCILKRKATSFVFTTCVGDSAIYVYWRLILREKYHWIDSSKLQFICT